MSEARYEVHCRLKELESAFEAFEAGERGRLFDSRDVLVALSEAVDRGGWTRMGQVLEVASKLLGILLRDGRIDECTGVALVRELLGVVEAGVEEEDPGAQKALKANARTSGVFRVINQTKLGDLLVRMGKLHPSQLEQAVILQKVSKDKKFGEVLLAMNVVDARTLENALGQQARESRATSPKHGQGIQLGGPLPDLPEPEAPDGEPAGGGGGPFDPRRLYDMPPPGPER